MGGVQWSVKSSGQPRTSLVLAFPGRPASPHLVSKFTSILKNKSCIGFAPFCAILNNLEKRLSAIPAGHGWW